MSPNSDLRPVLFGIYLIVIALMAIVSLVDTRGHGRGRGSNLDSSRNGARERDHSDGESDRRLYSLWPVHDHGQPAEVRLSDFPSVDHSLRDLQAGGEIMRMAECRTCRTPKDGKGPAVVPRMLVLLTADGKRKDRSDTYRYHKKREHDVKELPEVTP